MRITHLSIFIILLLLSLNAVAQKQSPQAYNPETGIQYLSGRGSDDAVNWEFYCTDGRRSGEWTTIPVPSCWELQGFGTYQYGMPFYGKANPPGIASEQGKYKYKFRLPKEWEGRVVRIVFEGVMTDCEALINGRRCGYLHQGAFYRFKSDVSDRVFFGDKENVLEVTVSKESANSSVNLAERRADYWNFGGIFRPVFIEALPPLFIDRTALDARADGSFHADIYLGAAMGDNATVIAEVTDANNKPVGKPVSVKIPAGSDRVVVSTKFDNINPWTPESPHLYYITLSLTSNDKTLHKVKERFGFRTVEVKESDGIYINGQRVLMKGVNRHSFRPETGRTLNREANYEDVRLIKEMNMNAVRLSHYPSDPEFLDACDELGLYVMVELAGWHGKYDTAVGAKLVREMVTRDLNHPSVIWWANGNEGGHNPELDKEFTALDPQKRPVLHPQKNFGGFETMHYRSYGESQEYMRQPEIFMPTEFLHALYDGGAGAGLYDYWEMMRKHPRCAGGFIWMFADEGVVRTDQNGRIDNVGNYGADGIVGPHHEREGSFYAIKQIWSPVQLMEDTLPSGFDGTFTVENRYDFTSLKDCSFAWELKTYGNEEKVIHSGKIAGLDVAPHQSGKMKINLPSDWRDAGALSVAAYGPSGEHLRTWDWDCAASPEAYYRFPTAKAHLSARDEGDKLLVTSGNTSLSFSKETGLLTEVELDGNRIISFGNGPRFVAARRGDRSMDVFYNHDDNSARSKERIYTDISGNDRLTGFDYETTPDSIVVTARYFGNLDEVRWVIGGDGKIRMDYRYRYDGVVELMGVCFDYPENNVIGKRWLGEGPYRAWQNRLQGINFGIWENQYADPIPGESFIYPEFKGYFANWKWMLLHTLQGGITLINGSSDNYIGVFTPRDGRDALLYTLPESGIAILDVIPAVRNKVNSTDLVGPSSQARWAEGEHKGSILLRFQ